MIIHLIKQPSRVVFPYGAIVRFLIDNYDYPSDETRRLIGQTHYYIREWAIRTFGYAAEPREFWLEEGTPSGRWYRSSEQFWFLNERDFLIFYMRFHTARR